nr:cytochrome P460 family protein [Azorhizobium oxalatiphilum]
MTASSVAAAIAALALVWPLHAEPTRVTFPDIESLTHYTTVRRGNVTEHILTTPAAIEAVKNGKPIPTDTTFVLADYRDGKIYRYFVMEKGAGWGADYDERRRTGDWQFQWFWPDRTINEKENTARCQSCHGSRADSEFLFTFIQLRDFDGRTPD